MSVSFQPYRPGEMCGICHAGADEDSSEFVSHGGEGDKHPFHKTCITEWIGRVPKCPACFVDVDPDPLSLKGRVSRELHPPARVHLQAVAFGLLAGVCRNGAPSIPSLSALVLSPMIELTLGAISRYFAPECDKAAAAIISSIVGTAGVYCIITDGLGI
ncbi:MAG: hypothetical protein JSS61_01105 [Verrucomicrobia bacterium]|nr:hypothetical protein [Verrucomicrobiota bacterium]